MKFAVDWWLTTQPHSDELADTQLETVTQVQDKMSDVGRTAADKIDEVAAGYVREHDVNRMMADRRLRQLTTQGDRPGARYRTGFADGGASLEPFARAGSPGMNRLHPPLPLIRSKNG